VVDRSDWRLTGQERYLQGATLIRRAYRPYARNPDWDHDHCSFCWATFSVEDHRGAQQRGYATPDDYHWVCETCFNDFKEMFEWKILDAPT
jgi:hypothetical protein